MAACLVESFGYELHYLGANTPVADVVGTVWRWRPALVLLAAVYPEHVSAMGRTVRALDALPDAVRPQWVMVGQGRARAASVVGPRAGDSPRSPAAEREGVAKVTSH